LFLVTVTKFRVTCRQLDQHRNLEYFQQQLRELVTQNFKPSIIPILEPIDIFQGEVHYYDPSAVASTVASEQIELDGQLDPHGIPRVAPADTRGFMNMRDSDRLNVSAMLRYACFASKQASKQARMFLYFDTCLWQLYTHQHLTAFIYFLMH
jgi:hypothetical protein